MPNPRSFCLAIVAMLALTGAAWAMPIGQPGSNVHAPTPGADVQPASWWCFQYGNCVWRPDPYYRQPYPFAGYPYYARPRYYVPRYRYW